MGDEDRPHDAEIEDVSARLSDALKSCHSVVENYKALLSGDQKDAEAAHAPAPGERKATDDPSANGGPTAER